ncbi:MAG: hypothetical protein E5Y02_10435 [Mesorhizobium sp.]|nr:MAG: hypothetical protein E5Y02_10435 [Mesorhizobium sp.]
MAWTILTRDCFVCEKTMKLRSRKKGNKRYCGKRCQREAIRARAVMRCEQTLIASGHFEYVERRTYAPMF